MSKKFKLNLNKEVISNLQAKEITGGNESGDICQTVISAPCRCRPIKITVSVNVECPWSLEGNGDSPSNAGMC